MTGRSVRLWCWPKVAWKAMRTIAMGADQWLFVVSGSGAAKINGREIDLGAGMMVLIERGDTHEIRNTGQSLLKTVSVYVPPAYRDEETELPAGKR